MYYTGANALTVGIITRSAALNNGHPETAYLPHPLFSSAEYSQFQLQLLRFLIVAVDKNNGHIGIGD